MFLSRGKRDGKKEWIVLCKNGEEKEREMNWVEKGESMAREESVWIWGMRSVDFRD